MISEYHECKVKGDYTMKGREKWNVLVILLVVTMVFAMAPIGAGMPLQAADTAYADELQIPAADVTYDNEAIPGGWEDGTLLIDENKTVKIRGVTHENSGEDGSPIKICNQATVNLVFEGENVLAGNPAKTSAGIEVEEGSTVNIYGLDGSRLTVTGGKESAGIGGIGYDIGENPTAGNINIYSGTITAVGGNKGSGIGSGNHSSASEINICGGDVTALGTGWGAGIGAGYGTSGGAQNPGAGFYNGGNITISGGTVRAAAWHMDFDHFDPYNPDSLYDGDYPNCEAAGIGGGYGSSSGKIIIEGNADVTALGSCGGAGIGTGRGTSKENKFDKEHADCNVTIRGNARVVAMAAKDTRSGASYYGVGGAGIGLGHGWNLDNEPKGSVTIDGNANVFAYADGGANGIGSSRVVGTTDAQMDPAHLASLTIGDGCTVVAVSGNPKPERAAFDEILAPDTIPAAALNFSNEFFATAAVGDEDPFFTGDKFPVRIDVRAAGSAEALTAFALPRPDPASTPGQYPRQVGVHLPAAAAADAYYKVKDYPAANGVGVLLANTAADNGWKFAAGATNVTHLLYEKYNIKYNLSGGKNAAGNPATYAVYGPAIKLANPTRSGYTFGGWFDNAKLTGSKVTSIPAGSVGDQQLWAKWTKKPAPKPAAKVSGTLLAKMTAKGKSSLVLTWSKVKGAEGYDIFFNKCGKQAPKKVKTIRGNKTFKWTKKSLKTKKAYKAVVKAYVMKNGKKKYVRTSPMVHAYTSGGTSKYTNAKGVTVKKTSVSLKAGKIYKVKASVTKLQKGKKLMPTGHAPKLRYVSSNKKVATVSKSGKVTAKNKGSCKVYVIAVNGASKAVKVTVK